MTKMSQQKKAATGCTERIPKKTCWKIQWLQPVAQCLFADKKVGWQGSVVSVLCAEVPEREC